MDEFALTVFRAIVRRDYCLLARDSENEILWSGYALPPEVVSDGHVGWRVEFVADRWCHLAKTEIAFPGDDIVVSFEWPPSPLLVGPGWAVVLHGSLSV